MRRRTYLVLICSWVCCRSTRGPHTNHDKTDLIARYLVSVPDNGDSRWSRYGLPAL